MRRLLAVVALVVCAAIPLRAQNCVTVNGISRCAMPWQVYDTAQRQVSTPVLDLTQIWNQVSTTFTGLKLNVTDTNSATGSLLLDLQVGGTSKFSVNKSGNVVAAGTFTATGAATVGGAVTFPNGSTLNDTSGSGKLALTGTTPMIQLGGTTSSFPALKRNGSSVDVRGADDAAYVGLTALNLIATNVVASNVAQITSGSATGLTVNVGGQMQRQVYKATVGPTAFVCAALTCDLTIGTLPAKTALLAVYADLTQTFACTATCTSTTLSFTLGSTAGGTDLLVSVDADAAIATKGLADADLGTALTRATAVQGGKVFSFSATTLLSMRFTSGTGNIGTGAATNLSQGSVTFYVVTEVLP